MEFEFQSFLLGLVPFVLGIGIVWSRFSKVLNAVKELADVLTTVVASFDDKEITKEEIKNIKREGIEALSALKAIFK